MFKADYHVHTAFSCDSEVPMEEMIKTGINKGLTEIAFTDHVDFDPRYPFTDYNKYIPFIKELQEKYKAVSYTHLDVYKRQPMHRLY